MMMSDDGRGERRFDRTDIVVAFWAAWVLFLLLYVAFLIFCDDIHHAACCFDCHFWVRRWAIMRVDRSGAFITSSDIVMRRHYSFGFVILLALATTTTLFPRQSFLHSTSSLPQVCDFQHETRSLCFLAQRWTNTGDCWLQHITLRLTFRWDEDRFKSLSFVEEFQLDSFLRSQSDAERTNALSIWR